MRYWLQYYGYVLVCLQSIDLILVIICYSAYLGFTLSTTIIAPSWSLLCITSFASQRKNKEQHANACNLETDMIINTADDSMSHLVYYMEYITVLYTNQRTLEETGKRGKETYNLNSCLQLCGS